MFCSNCGAEAGGNFCWKCGQRLQEGSAPQPVPPGPPPLPRDWSREIVYETLIHIPAVRDKISRHAAMAKKRLSGEQFLAFADKVAPMGVSMETIGSVVHPISAMLGIKTGKECTETVTSPPGVVLVSALCSLARNGQALQRVQQLDDGCLLEASLPSDLWSFEGSLFVGVRRAGPGTRVDCATQIKGQFFDWGKSKRCLETLCADVKTTPA